MRPQIIVYCTNDDSETRRTRMLLADILAAAKWGVQAPDEPLTSAPPLAGLGWVRFRGPRERDAAGRSEQAQAVLTTERRKWQALLEEALDSIGPPVVRVSPRSSSPRSTSSISF